MSPMSCLRLVVKQTLVKHVHTTHTHARETSPGTHTPPNPDTHHHMPWQAGTHTHTPALAHSQECRPTENPLSVRSKGTDDWV